MGEKSDKGKKRVFISYSYKDRSFSNKLANQLQNSGFSVFRSESDIASNELVLHKMISYNDYVLVLLSKNSFRSSKFEIAFMNELLIRDVKIIPIRLDDCRIPNFLNQFQVFDLRNREPSTYLELVNLLDLDSRVDFSSFSASRFESLITSILRKLDFTIKLSDETRDRGIDLIAEYNEKDPFGVESKVTWIVEIKLYHKERAGISTLNQMFGLLSIYPGARGLLITNGQLTSHAKQWLKEVQEEKNGRLRVIEGPELRNIVLRFPDIVDKYFPPTALRTKNDY